MVRIGDDSIDCVSREILAPLCADYLFVSLGFVESHDPRAPERRELRAALAFEFSQALILVAGLNCDPIVEAIEFAGEVSQRFARVL